jgi:hypothetical protein
MNRQLNGVAGALPDEKSPGPMKSARASSRASALAGKLHAFAALLRSDRGFIERPTCPTESTAEGS